MTDLHLEVAGCAVLLVGGGAALAVEAARLHRQGANVTVVPSTATAACADLVDRGLVAWADGWTDQLVATAALVVAIDPSDDLRRACRAARVPLQVLTTRRKPPVTASPDAAPAGVAARRATECGEAARGRVTLVGGGPGDPDLLTVAGLEALQQADVVVYDRLAPLAALAGLDAELIDVAKVPRGRSTSQESINAVLVEAAEAGHNVVRLKGGDNYVFGRGGEEAIACAAAGIDVQVIPGVTSAVAGPALAGIPLTHRGVSQGFSVISGHAAPGDPASTIDYAALAQSGTTIVLLMAVDTLPAILAELGRHGLQADTPGATIADAGLPSQRVVRSTLDNLAADVASAGLRPPAVTVVGPVAGLDWSSQRSTV